MAECKVRPANLEEWDEAMDLAWVTFLRFVADGYTKEGVDNFWDFIHDEMLKRMFSFGSYRLFVAVSEGKIVGMISLRDGNHISLLFVKEAMHRKGVGTSLMDYVCRFVQEDMHKNFVTVNASPYGVKFYENVGFEASSGQIEQHGIKYTPMKRILD